jgi:hypothetical protein
MRLPQCSYGSNPITASKAYINEFKDYVDLSGYTNPIVIVLNFCQGLNSMTQDRIAESGTNKLSDMDFNGWVKAA